jgi:hypothetical protein
MHLYARGYIGNMKLCFSSWKSIYILRELKKDDINISEKTKNEIHDEMWRNLIAEYDANFLSQYLQSRLKTFSLEFQEFWKIWLHDENNHYMGIRKYIALSLKRMKPSHIDELFPGYLNFLK